MADIKTRDMVKGSIKTIDKSAVAAQRMKYAFIQTKEKAEHAIHTQESSAEEYASNRMESGIDRVSHEAVHQFDKQGRKGFEATKQNVSKAKDGIRTFKEKRAAQSLEKQGIRTTRNKGVMDEIGLSHRPKRKPNGITRADREARKSDDLLKRDFKSNKPLEKCVTDITEIKAKDGKLYVSAIFDCFDSSVLGLAMETNMKATLCEHTLDNAYLAYPNLRGAILHSDRGTQYTSETYRKALAKYGIIQSMNSAGGRCHDNARCESMWARMKSELLYDRYNTETMTTEELKVLIWRYFISYWNNRRICSANGGLPPIIKRQRYYQSLDLAA